MIPRRLHQIYLGGELPQRLVEHVATVRTRNPDWDYHLFDAEKAERFIRDAFGSKLLSVYEAIDPAYGAARADLLRHLIIFRNGGVYLDVKTNPTRSLTDVLRPSDEYVLTQWQNGLGQARQGFGLHRELRHVPGGEYQTHHIIARAGHPFSMAVIRRITRNVVNYRPWTGVGRMGVLRTTGPIAYTLAIHPLLATSSHRLTTETELGIEFSISDYDHHAVFKKHYSTLSQPVVRMSKLGRLATNGVERLRDWKHQMIG